MITLHCSLILQQQLTFSVRATLSDSLSVRTRTNNTALQYRFIGLTTKPFRHHLWFTFTKILSDICAVRNDTNTVVLISFTYCFEGPLGSEAESVVEEKTLLISSQRSPSCFFLTLVTKYPMIFFKDSFFSSKNDRATQKSHTKRLHNWSAASDWSIHWYVPDKVQLSVTGAIGRYNLAVWLVRFYAAKASLLDNFLLNDSVSLLLWAPWPLVDFLYFLLVRLLFLFWLVISTFGHKTRLQIFLLLETP